MSVNLAELDSRCYLSLAPASEYIDLSMMHNAVVQRVNVRTMQSRNSNANVLLGTSDEFTPDVIDYDITDLIGKGIPCFIETRQVAQENVSWWQNIRVVPLSQLNDYMAMGAFACAFYGDETASETAQPTQYVKFTFLPAGVCRIRFDRDTQRTALSSDMLLPDNLADLPVREAQNDLIPAIQLAIQMDMRRDEAGRPFAAGITAALNNVFMQNEKVIRELDALWRNWAYTDRAKEANFNNPTPNGQWLYVGGRNRNWGNGGFGGGY